MNGLKVSGVLEVWLLLVTKAFPLFLYFYPRPNILKANVHGVYSKHLHAGPGLNVILLHPDWSRSCDWVEALSTACGGTLTVLLGLDVVAVFVSTLKLILCCVSL